MSITVNFLLLSFLVIYTHTAEIEIPHKSGIQMVKPVWLSNGPIFKWCSNRTIANEWHLNTDLKKVRKSDIDHALYLTIQMFLDFELWVFASSLCLLLLIDP